GVVVVAFSAAGFFVDEAAFVLPVDFFATGGAPTAAGTACLDGPSDVPAVRRVMPRTAADATATATRNARMPRALPRFRLPALARARRCVAGRATGCGIVEKSWAGCVAGTVTSATRSSATAGASTSGSGIARAGSASITRRATGPGSGSRAGTGKASTTGSTTTGVDVLLATGATSSWGGSTAGAGTLEAVVSPLGAAGAGGALSTGRGTIADSADPPSTSRSVGTRRAAGEASSV